MLAAYEHTYNYDFLPYMYYTLKWCKGPKKK